MEADANSKVTGPQMSVDEPVDQPAPPGTLATAMDKASAPIPIDVPEKQIHPLIDEDLYYGTGPDTPPNAT